MKLENIIYRGDGLAWLKQFPDKCIDLCIARPKSPPRSHPGEPFSPHSPNINQRR